MHRIPISKTLIAPRLLIISGLVAALFIGVVYSLFFPASNNAAAARKEDWVAGNIVSDPIFTDNNSMSVQAIQDLLNRSIGGCDVYGTGKASEFGSSLTRAQYAKSRGWPGPPYTCLNLYYEVPKVSPGGSMPANNYSNPSSKPSGSQSAAWIIKDAANRYRISPKTLLVKIATESAGPLTHDKWPLFSQYRYAMGARCPDSGPGGSANCDGAYAGFSIQMYEAARLIRYYLDNMQQPWWSLKKPYQNNSILWNVVERGCGAGNVYIQNKATAALYTYTPYQPNQAALNNMYGTGDNCSAYGNRNFWRVFWDWFGNTRGGEARIRDAVRVSSNLTVTPNGSDNEKQQYTARFSIKNTSDTSINVGWLLVSVRDKNGFNLDFPIKRVSIGPQQTYTYQASRSFQWTDTMTAYINGNIAQGIGWSTSQPASVNSSIVRKTTFRVGSDVVINSSGLKVEKTARNDELRATVGFTNRTASPVTIGWFLVSARDSAGNNIDFPIKQISVPANGTATYSDVTKINPTLLGTYTFYTNLNDPGGRGWTTTYPMRNDIWTKTSQNLPIGPAIIQTQPVQLSIDQQGNATATTTFKNQGTISENLGWVIKSTRREGDSTNYDFAPQAVSIAPGQSKTVSFSQQLLRPGAYTTSLLFNRGTNGGWTSTYAPPASPNIARSASMSLAEAPIQQVGSATVSSSSTTRTVSVRLKNTSASAVNAGWLIPSLRDSAQKNFDFPGVEIILKPGEERVFRSSRTIPNGQYTLSLTVNHPQYGWGTTFKAQAPVTLRF